MLSEPIVKKLNEQLNLEFYSSNLYLQMSAWCNNQGFEGAAAGLPVSPFCAKCPKACPAGGRSRGRPVPDGWAAENAPWPA